MIKVTRVQPIAGYKLQLEFSDGMGGVYDLSPCVNASGAMVLPLREREFFERVFLEQGAPTWPNGYDLAPWALHRELGDKGALVRLRSDAAE